MVNVVRPTDRKPLEQNGRFKLEWDTFFSVLLNAVNAVSQSSLVATKSFTVATVPSAADVGRVIYVSNEAGGAVLAFSDGVNWRRVTDRAIIS